MSNTKTPRKSFKRRNAPTKRAMVGKNKITRSTSAARIKRQIKRKSNK